MTGREIIHINKEGEKAQPTAYQLGNTSSSTITDVRIVDQPGNGDALEEDVM